MGRVFKIFFGVHIHRFSGQCVACVVIAKSESFTSKWKHKIINIADSSLATIDAAIAAHPERRSSIPGLRVARVVDKSKREVLSQLDSKDRIWTNIMAVRDTGA